VGSLNCFLRPPNKIEEKEENRSIEEMGETRVEQYRERGGMEVEKEGNM